MDPYKAPESSIHAIPDEKEFSYEDAPLGKRFLAGLIDVAIFCAFWFGWGFFQMMDVPEFIPEAEFDEALGDALDSGWWVASVVFILLNTPFWIRSAQSLGKLALGLRITRKSGEDCHFYRLLLLRVAPVLLVGGIYGVGLLLLVIDVVLVFREEPFAMHDDLSDTAVIQ